MCTISCLTAFTEYHICESCLYKLLHSILLWEYTVLSIDGHLGNSQFGLLTNTNHVFNQLLLFPFKYK